MTIQGILTTAFKMPMTLFIGILICGIAMCRKGDKATRIAYALRMLNYAWSKHYCTIASVAFWLSIGSLFFI